METQIGMIADMLQSVDDGKTPLQNKLDKLGKTLAIAALLVCGLVFLLGLARSGVFTQGFTKASTAAVLESFMIAVGLAIAAVPEGLSAVVTISLALGMREMIKRHALIRKLQAVETLGSITVICSDKTGTLTENRMTVTVVDMASHILDFTHEAEYGAIRSLQEVLQVEAPDEKQLEMLRACPTLLHTLAGGTLCNDAIIEPHPEKEERFVMIGDPTEGALVVAAARMGLTKKLLMEALPREAEVPFDSERKRMTTAHRLPDKREDLHEAVRELWSWGVDEEARYLAYTKGSVDGLLDIADKLYVEGRVVPLESQWRERIEAANAHMAEQGVRVLGLAYRTLAELPDELKADDVETGMTFVGMVGMIDPARPEVKDAVALCKSAGIRPIMITGDHPLTARHIAEDLGISTNGKALTGAEKGRYWRGHGHHRHRRRKRNRRYGADRRQLCQHRGGSGAGPRDLCQYPQICVLHALDQFDRNHGYLCGCAPAAAYAADRYPTADAEPADGRLPRAGACRRKRRAGGNAETAQAEKRANHQKEHGGRIDHSDGLPDRCGAYSVSVGALVASRRGAAPRAEPPACAAALQLGRRGRADG